MRQKMQRILVAMTFAAATMLGMVLGPALAQQPYPAPQGVGEITAPTAALVQAPEPNWFKPGETGIKPVNPEQFSGMQTFSMHKIDGVPLQVGQDYWLLGRHIFQDGKRVLARCNNTTIGILEVAEEPFGRWFRQLGESGYPYIGLKAKLVDDTNMTFQVLDVVGLYANGYCDVPVNIHGWSEGTLWERDGSRFLSPCWSSSRQNRDRYWDIQLALVSPIIAEITDAHEGYYTRVQAQVLEEDTGTWRRGQVITHVEQIHFVDPAGCGRRQVIYMPQAWRNACPLGMRVPNYNCKTRMYERFLPMLPQPPARPNYDLDTGHYRVFMPLGWSALTTTYKTDIVARGGIMPKAQPLQSAGWRLSPLRQGLPPLTLGNSVVVTEDADAVAQITGDGRIINLIGDGFDRGDVSPGGIDCKDGQACLVVNSNHANTWQGRFHDGRLVRITAPSNERTALKSMVVVLGQIGNGLHLAVVTESANCPTPTWSCGGNYLVHLMINIATNEIFEVDRMQTDTPAAWGSVAEYNGEQLLHAYTREGVVYTLNWLTWTEARPRINDAPIVANLAMDEPLWEPGNMAWINGTMSLDGRFMFLGSGDHRGVIWIDLWDRTNGIASLKTAFVRSLGMAMNHDEQSPYYGLLAAHLTSQVAVFRWDPATHDLVYLYGSWFPGWMQRTWEDDDQGDLAWVRDGLITNFNMPLPGTRAPALEFVKFGLLNRAFLLLEGYNVNPRNWPLDPGTPPPDQKLKAWGNSAWNQEHPGFKLPNTPTPVPPTSTPTPTETATATPIPTMTLTPTPAPCVPGIMPADIVLIVDRSGSMTGEKLSGAKLAANVFLEQVKKSGRPDRVALVAFDRTAGMMVHLTRDWKALESAIQSLEPGLGTYIDLGLKEASDELSFAKVPDRGQVVILLSDGGQNGTVLVPELIKMAEDMKISGIIIFTIGLGTDADEATLKAMAWDPLTHYFKSPTGADLTAIYQRIAIAIPCGTPTPAP